MAAALALLALLGALASAAPDPPLAVDNKGPLGFDLNELLAKLLAHFDPYSVDVVVPPFDVDIAELSAKGSVSNAVITGASGLRLLSLTLTELGDGKAAVSLRIPSIQAVGDYQVTGAIKKPVRLPLDSAGNFTFGFTELAVNASVQLGISDEGQILLKDFQLPYWNLTDIELNLGGLFNNQALGHMINDILHDTLTHIITKAYHDQLTTLVTKNILTLGGKYLASLHHDHARPELQGANVRRGVPEANQAVVAAPVRGSSSTGLSATPSALTPAAQPAQPVQRTDLLSLVGLDSEELRGLLTFDLAAPRFYPRGTLSDDEDDEDDEDLAGQHEGSMLGTREAPVDKPFGLQLAPARFYGHGELAPEGAQGAQEQALQGLLPELGVKLQPVGKPVFYKKGHLSRVRP